MSCLNKVQCVRKSICGVSPDDTDGRFNTSSRVYQTLDLDVVVAADTAATFWTG